MKKIETMFKHIKRQLDRQNIECESPTADKISIGCLLSLAAIEGWEIETFDVSEAFLQQLPMKDLEGIMKRARRRRKIWRFYILQGKSFIFLVIFRHPD